MTRILLADDHEVMRRGLRGLLTDRVGWEVCGEARTGREAVALAARLRPDVAILDLAMPELNGVEATRQIRHEVPETEVLVFTMHETDQLVREVLEAGARGYLLKSDAAEHLVAAVDALARHQPYFTATVSRALLDAFLSAGHDRRDARDTGGTLTPREREIIQLLAEGASSKEMSEILGIGVRTVEAHRAAIMRKLGAGSLAELVRYAVRNHLVEP